MIVDDKTPVERHLVNPLANNLSIGDICFLVNKQIFLQLVEPACVTQFEVVGNVVINPDFCTEII